MDQTTKLTKNLILTETIKIIDEMTNDWDIDFSGAIGSDTKIIEDLSFESIDVVQLVGTIEEHFNKTQMPFEEILIKDGNYVDEIMISEIVDFIDKQVNLSGGSID